VHPKIEIEIEIAAPRSRVFEALTRARELERWFAEKAFVSPSEDRFDFWGRFTPGNPDEVSGRHRLLAYDPPKSLAFEWPLRGKRTRVEVVLSESEQGTLLRLEHDAPPRGATEISIADFWLLSFENLRRLLEDGAKAVRCDYGKAARGRVELALEIAASPEEVFRALTRPEEIDVWMTAKSEVEPFAGGRYSFGWQGEGPIRILEIVPNEKLSYTWAHGNDPETVVSWTLEGSGGTTRLLLVHSGFADRETEDFRTGWLKHALWMKSLVEGELWRPPVIEGACFDA
jgi:uncharacterized protein YndB with AHSA1/START domain